mmetsp:Transcript_43797/g.93121  ORF Transcript_43797/g.93121 Transcript_43797/m.93121 type:complete len:538 (+) Transcript_43797:106-1719(+)|eukprot:CAMPEP_0172535806 /NCGR_PEP_ID=MMETSP1067-20121228/7645_1 /TAXON_ID=265564 ORGANISM="Thalassiosira punctigera, Strain Tpunct2005C2" /NCGR_SAMPLE_ID=MMETSP1067 /ASSEMBLY_ACC=CAM_ASM_000444 /LENGTH=537 /DNA_ID=CAMNT_0013320755 /DNA_START=85 /DNA_END=1698 /DNA_ORIENTATION=-
MKLILMLSAASFGTTFAFHLRPGMSAIILSRPQSVLFKHNPRGNKVVPTLYMENNGQDDIKDVASALVKKCSIFRDMTPEDILRIANSMQKQSVEKGQILISQGSTNDEFMYFLESGSVEFTVVDKKGRSAVVGDAKAGSSFGELALLFNKPRAATVRATKNSTVWALSEKALMDVTGNYPDLMPQIRKDLREQYKELGVLDKIYKVKEDFRDSFVVANRPVKKKVSLHSFLCTMTFGVLATAWIPSLRPAWINGLPQLFDPVAQVSNGVILQQVVAQLLLAASGFLGKFRFARNTPAIRKKLFNTIYRTVIASGLLSISNLAGFDFYLIDAWSWPGKTLILWFVLGALSDAAILIYSYVKGPAEKHWYSNTFFETRRSSFFSVLWYALTAVMNTYPTLVLFRSKEWFNTVALPLYKASGFNVFIMFMRLQAVSYLSLGALVATFQHEKRLTFQKCRLWLGSLFLLSQFDVVKQQLFSLGVGGTVANGEAYKSLYSSVFQPLFKQTQFAKFYAGYFGSVILLGTLSAWKMTRKEASA